MKRSFLTLLFLLSGVAHANCSNPGNLTLNCDFATSLASWQTTAGVQYSATDGASAPGAASLSPSGNVAAAVRQCVPVSSGDLHLALARRRFTNSVACAITAAFYSDACATQVGSPLVFMDSTFMDLAEQAFVAKSFNTPVPALATFALVGYACQGFGTTAVDDFSAAILGTLLSDGFE